ncbi:FAD-binding oxidoreductase [Hoeflea sp. CAU 1731]
MSVGTVLIVGAGITGVCTAEWLRRDGWDVTLIDPLEPGSEDQTSYGNAGLLSRTSVMPVATESMVRKAPSMVLDPDSPLFLRWSYLPRLLPWLIPFVRNAKPERVRDISVGIATMTSDTNEQHLALVRGTDAQTFICSGEFVSLFPQRENYESDVFGAEIRGKYGLYPEKMDRAELVERDPNIGPHYNFATVFKDICWLSSPGGYVRAIFSHFKSNGGGYRQSRVMSITPGTAPSVVLEGGEILSADKIVLSAGAWSGKIARAFGVSMNIEAERGYHIAIRDPQFTAPQPYLVSDAKIIMTPMDGFLRAAGVAEFGGLNAPPSSRPLEVIKKGVRKVYPNLKFDVTENWMGRRPTTPDSLPVIGEDMSAPNILHAYGGQHIGLTIGPKVGRIIADLAGRRRPNIDLSVYRPDRF